jgi:hypothetical protein
MVTAGKKADPQNIVARFVSDFEIKLEVWSVAGASETIETLTTLLDKNSFNFFDSLTTLTVQGHTIEVRLSNPYQHHGEDQSWRVFFDGRDLDEALVEPSMHETGAQACSLDKLACHCHIRSK